MSYQGPYQYYQPPMQTPQVPQQPIGIPGRVIHNPAEVRPNEVPMDGRKSYFPTDDERYIYAKQWNSDGTIRTVKYEKCKDEPTIFQDGTSDTGNAILERLDKIEKLLKEVTE